MRLFSKYYGSMLMKIDKMK